MSRLRLLGIAALLVLAAAGFLFATAGTSPPEPIPSSERQMPDFGPPIVSDRPDLWEEPRIEPEEEPG